MSVTEQQRHAIDCVVAIFETGKVPDPTPFVSLRQGRSRNGAILNLSQSNTFVSL